MAMTKARFVLSCGIFFLISLILLAVARSDSGREKSHVLVLHSYHGELPWSRGLMQGLERGFQDSGLPLVMHVEYMDGIRHRQEENFPVMKDYLSQKYARVPLQGVLATDDVALDFLLLYRDEIFPGLPLVFCGPNDFTPERLEFQERITGIAENPDMRGTIGLIRRLHPKASSIAVVSDRNPASLRVIEGLKKIAGELGQPGLFSLLTDASLEALLAELQALPRGTPVVFHAFLRDASGKTYASNLKNLRLLASRSGLPFYTFKKIDIGEGAVGGAVISEERMAEIAAGMVLQILKGLPPQGIPVIYHTPQVYLFDYPKLRDFKIPPEILPAGSILINRPFPLYHEHRTAFYIAGAALLLLLCLLIVLTLKNRRERRHRRNAEQHLRESQDRYRSIIVVSNTGAWEFNRETNHQWCSPEYFSMIGHDAAEFTMNGGDNLRQVWTDFLHPEDREPALAFFRDYLNRGSEGLYEQHFRMRHKEGHWVWIWSRGKTLCRPDGSLTPLTLGTHINISDIRDAEARREKLQAQLLQAQKMESVGILAGGVAHDFNNLIQVMRGNLELLAMGATLDTRSMQRLDVVAGAMDRAAKLVQQLLFFSRKAESSRVRMDINDEIRMLSHLLERIIPRMISMELHLCSGISPVCADPVQMEQALLNLANNAADAMPEGGRLIFETKNVDLDDSFVKTHEGACRGPHVLISVSDTGCGMDAETLSHAFDPFFTTKEVGKGSGLGLASVYGIVKAHGGYLQCYSEPGHGTVFNVYFPVVDEGGTELKTLPEPSLPGTGSETLLLVDDEAHIREMGREALENAGYTVLCAGSGEEALTIYGEEVQRIDLILLDLNMPGMGGHRCLRELLKKNPHARVLISSGYSANGQAMEALASGAMGFIGKPWLLKELMEKVREVLT